MSIITRFSKIALAASVALGTLAFTGTANASFFGTPSSVQTAPQNTGTFQGGPIISYFCLPMAIRDGSGNLVPVAGSPTCTQSAVPVSGGSNGISPQASGSFFNNLPVQQPVPVTAPQQSSGSSQSFFNSPASMPFGPVTGGQSGNINMGNVSTGSVFFGNPQLPAAGGAQYSGNLPTCGLFCDFTQTNRIPASQSGSDPVSFWNTYQVR